ncbi:MAG: PHB depolymerase family esterase [Planctomycetota bacterium]
MSAFVLATVASAQEENSIQQRPGFMEGYKDVTQGRYEQGVAKLKSVVAAYPNDPDVGMASYNIVCGLSRQGEVEEALQWLQRAFDQGYGCNAKHLQRMEHDPDLEAVRPLPEFQALLEQMKRRVLEIQQSWPEEKKAFVLTPSGYDAKKTYPLLVMLHPYGEYKAHFAEVFRKFADEQQVIVMCPTAQVLLAPKRFAWFTDLSDFLANFRMEQRAIWEEMERVKKEFAVDGHQMYVAGYSQGATLAFTMGLRNPQYVAGALVIAGFYRMETVKDDDWLLKSGGHALPVAFLQPKGDRDENVEQARNARDALRAAGVNVHYIEYDGERALPAAAVTEAWHWLTAQKKKAWSRASRACPPQRAPVRSRCTERRRAALAANDRPGGSATAEQPHDRAAVAAVLLAELELRAASSMCAYSSTRPLAACDSWTSFRSTAPAARSRGSPARHHAVNSTAGAIAAGFAAVSNSWSSTDTRASLSAPVACHVTVPRSIVSAADVPSRSASQSVPVRSSKPTRCPRCLAASRSEDAPLASR